MSRWRAEYDDGIWRFYRDGMELGLYERGDVVVDALNAAESRIAELVSSNMLMAKGVLDLKARIAELEARAEKAEAMVEKLIEAGRMMKQPETIEEFHRGRRDYDALVAEWKEREE